MDGQTLRDLQDYLSLSDPLALPDNESSNAIAAEEPFLVASQRGGIALDMNEQRVGMMLGWQQRAAILLSRDSEVIVFVRMNLDSPERAEIYVRG